MAQSIAERKSCRTSILDLGCPNAIDAAQPQKHFAVCRLSYPVSLLGKEGLFPVVHLHSPQQLRDALSPLEMLPVCALGAGRSHPSFPQDMDCSRRLNENMVAGDGFEPP